MDSCGVQRRGGHTTSIARLLCRRGAALLDGPLVIAGAISMAVESVLLKYSPDLSIWNAVHRLP